MKMTTPTMTGAGCMTAAAVEEGAAEDIARVYLV
jgi:hypothetical protein